MREEREKGGKTVKVVREKEREEKKKSRNRTV